jgi:hypothetical protein
MKSLVDTLFVLCFVLVFVACIGGLILHAVFLDALRRRHPQTWEELGCPSLIMNNSLRSSLKTLGFLLSGRYVTLGDKKLTALCTFMRWYDAAYLLLFLLTLVLLFIPILGRH